MAHPSPETAIAGDDKGRYKQFTGAVRQSFKSLTSETKQQPKGFWSILAKKAKSALLVDDDNSPSTSANLEPGERQECGTSEPQFVHVKTSSENRQHRVEPPSLHKGLEAFTSSLSFIGGTIGNAIEEGLNIVETKATDLISSDSRRLFSKKTMDSSKLNQRQDPNLKSSQQREAGLLGDSTADKETQLKASRDVAMAMAAKAKLLLRELKDAKADLALAKDRCHQLEEENKRIRECFNDGSKPDEEDLVRIQLETLLAEKARLAQENAYFARENQYLREMLEYHQLTMQNGNFPEEGFLDVAEMTSELDAEGVEGHAEEGSPTAPG